MSDKMKTMELDKLRKYHGHPIRVYMYPGDLAIGNYSVAQVRQDGDDVIFRSNGTDWQRTQVHAIGTRKRVRLPVDHVDQEVAIYSVC